MPSTVNQLHPPGPAPKEPPKEGSLGAEIRKDRKGISMSQGKLAKKSGLETAANISSIELGKSFPPKRTIRAIGKTLNKNYIALWEKESSLWEKKEPRRSQKQPPLEIIVKIFESIPRNDQWQIIKRLQGIYNNTDEPGAATEEYLLLDELTGEEVSK
jgi:transcriptional regulator with XRE-family HTH domain